MATKPPGQEKPLPTQNPPEANPPATRPDQDDKRRGIDHPSRS